jgi:hypothetical protein
MIYGLDVHKEFIQVCALGAKGSKRKEYRIAGTEEAIKDWALKLGPRDRVVLEATFHSWAIHAIVSGTAGRVAVANPMEEIRHVSPGGRSSGSARRRWGSSRRW